MPVRQSFSSPSSIASMKAYSASWLLLPLLLLLLAAAAAVMVNEGSGDTALGSLKNSGTVEAVEGMVARIFADRFDHFATPFEFRMLGEERVWRHAAALLFHRGSSWWISISGTTASELGAGLGFYLREIANMTFGWKRGGGNHIRVPPKGQAWPKVGVQTLSRRRNTPWSYMMNVCTHSYSLVWYSWKEWEAFLDWMSSSGINLFLALTGQEEVQYKVFSNLGSRKTFANGSMALPF